MGTVCGRTAANQTNGRSPSYHVHRHCTPCTDQPTIVDSDLLQPTGVHVTDIAEVDIEFCNLATLRSDQLPRRFQIAVSQKILEWIADVTDQSTEAIWVSFHQLLIDFQSFSGHNGPCSNGQNWTSLEPDHYDHPQRVKWYAQYLTNLCKTISFPPDIQQRRPPSSVLAFWSGHVQDIASIQKGCME